MRRVASLVPVLLAASTLMATAQPSSGTVFISAAAFAAIEKEPTFGGLGQPAGDLGGTVAGGALGLGVHLTEKVSARFEWSLTDTLRQSLDYSYPFYPPHILAVLALPVDLLPSTVPANSETRRSTSAGFALLGYHVTAGRASIEVLGGLGIINTDVTTDYDFRIARSFASIYPLPSNSNSTYDAVAVVGADVAVALTEHAAIVPQVRAYVRDGGMSVRPGLALRWTF